MKLGWFTMLAWAAALLVPGAPVASAQTMAPEGAMAADAAPAGCPSLNGMVPPYMSMMFGQAMPNMLRNMPMMGQGMQMGWHFGADMGGMPVRIDDNNDGLVGADEVAVRHQMLFETMDRDNDSFLSDQEFLAFGPPVPTRQQFRAEVFKQMDTDGDGKVGLAEFMAFGEKRQAAADVNKDGQVTVWEFRSLRPFW